MTLAMFVDLYYYVGIAIWIVIGAYMFKCFYDEKIKRFRGKSHG